MKVCLQNAQKALQLLPRAICILLVLVAPVLAVPSMRDHASSTIEAPAMKKNGVGFVLLMSLQRS